MAIQSPMQLPDFGQLDPQDAEFAIDMVDRMLPFAVEVGASDILELAIRKVIP